MPNCALKSCKNWNKNTKNQNISFHQFPKDEGLQKLWVNACGMLITSTLRTVIYNLILIYKKISNNFINCFNSLYLLYSLQWWMSCSNSWIFTEYRHPSKKQVMCQCDSNQVFKYYYYFKHWKVDIIFLCL